MNCHSVATGLSTRRQRRVRSGVRDAWRHCSRERCSRASRCQVTLRSAFAMLSRGHNVDRRRMETELRVWRLAPSSATADAAVGSLMKHTFCCVSSQLSASLKRNCAPPAAAGENWSEKRHPKAVPRIHDMAASLAPHTRAPYQLLPYAHVLTYAHSYTLMQYTNPYTYTCAVVYTHNHIRVYTRIHLHAHMHMTMHK